MKSPFCLSLAAVLAGCATVSALATAAYSSPDRPAQSSPATATWEGASFHINNKNGLVTVQDKNDKYVFAQVIATANLRIKLLKPAKSRTMQITLSDANNKKIWDTRVTSEGPAQFGFKFGGTKDEQGVMEAKGVTLSLSPDDDPSTNQFARGTSEKSEGEIVLASDGFPAAVTMGNGGDKMVLTRTGNKFIANRFENGVAKDPQVMEMDFDKSTGHLSADGKTVDFDGSAKKAVVSEGGKSYTVGTTVKDDKTYTVLMFGDRVILIEGANFTVSGPDNAIMIRPTPAPQ